jgi:hypothetical protein
MSRRRLQISLEKREDIRMMSLYGLTGQHRTVLCVTMPQLRLVSCVD